MLEDAVKDIATKTITQLLGLDNKQRTDLLAASLREMLLRVETVSTIARREAMPNPVSRTSPVVSLNRMFDGLISL